MPDEVFRVKKKKKKKLTEASADENFSNNEVEKIQCARCEGEEETCGAIMLIQTRARKLRESKNQEDLSVAESIPVRGPGSKHEADITPNSKPKPSTENRTKLMHAA